MYGEPYLSHAEPHHNFNVASDHVMNGLKNTLYSITRKGYVMPFGTTMRTTLGTNVKITFYDAVISDPVTHGIVFMPALNV